MYYFKRLLLSKQDFQVYAKTNLLAIYKKQLIVHCGRVSNRVLNHMVTIRSAELSSCPRGLSTVKFSFTSEDLDRWSEGQSIHLCCYR